MALNFEPSFPDEFVSPKEKENPKYGAQYAEAMYTVSDRFGARIGDDNDEYDALNEIAQGRQSVDNIKQIFGHYNVEAETTDGGAEDLAYIDIQVLNLAPKYINKAVGRMQAIKYDVSAAVLDPTSVDEEKQYKNQLKAFFDLKKWVDTIGVSAQKLFPNIDVANVPEEPDEFLFEINTNPKIKKAIKAEKALKGLHYWNNWHQISREVDWDMVVHGRGYVHLYLDSNGMPREEHLDNKWVIHPHSNSELHDDVDYFGIIEFVPSQQFIRESAKDIKPKKQKELIKEFGRESSYQTTGAIGASSQEYDGISYMPVLKYYFLSEDRKSFDFKKNQHGNSIKKERAYDYEPPDDQKHLYEEGGENKIVKNTYTSTYGGCWIIDSDVAYNHRRLDLPRTTLVDQKLPIKGFSPNYKNGRVVSLASQMIEPIYMINVAWNKIKDILAKGWMGVREINFDELEKVSLGRGGSQWSPRQVYSHLLKTNTLIKRGKNNIHDQSNGPAIVDGKGGLQLADYFTTINMALRFLDEITGTSSVEGAAPPERLAVGVANANMQASHEGMEYLYNGHHQMYLECSKALLPLAQMSHKMGYKVAGHALGDAFEIDDEVAYSEVGIMLERQPTEQEWADFYLDIREMQKAKMITSSDAAFVREVDNLKEARRILAIREAKQERKIRKEQIAVKDDQIEIAQAAAGAKQEGEAASLRLKGQIAADQSLLDGEIADRALDKKYAFDYTLVGRKGEFDKIVKETEGKDRIITQAMKNKIEREKVNKREDKSPED